MKVLLQDVRTRQFLAGHRDWTADSEEAFDFGQVVDALDYALGWRLENVRAVLQPSNSGRQLELPSVVCLTTWCCGG